jgi:hypothetical protein
MPSQEPPKQEEKNESGPEQNVKPNMNQESNTKYNIVVNFKKSKMQKIDVFSLWEAMIGCIYE